MRLSTLTLALITSAAALPVLAVESLGTPLVVGHKPTIGVTIDNQTPSVGDALTAITSNYQDKDEDAEGTPIYRWLRDGTPVAGENAVSYIPRFRINTPLGVPCSEINVVAEVTPTSATGDPKIGDATLSAPVRVPRDFSIIPGFTFPEVTTNNWAEAVAFCQARGGKVLPTVAQLQEVFARYTSGVGSNLEMSEKYGWPLRDSCGGATNLYRTIELDVGDPSGDFHDVVSMDTGARWSKAHITGSYHVTCVEPPSNTAPIASAVAFNPANPVAGSAVTVSWSYSDAESDAQKDTKVEWLLDGVIVHTETAQTSPSVGYTLGNVQGQTLTVRVTPQDDKGLEGAPVESPGVAIAYSVSSLAITTNNQPADDASENSVTAEVLDFNGDPVVGVVVAWESPSTTATFSKATSTTDASGKATVGIKNTKAENVIVTAKVQSNTADAGASQAVDFALHPVVTALVAGTNNVPGNNTSLNTVVATVQDLAGNLLANQPVTLTYTANVGTASFANASPWTTTTDASGQVTIRVKDNSAAAKAVTVTTFAQGASDTKTAAVNFVAYDLTQTVVDGATFTKASGFPTVGYTGASFTPQVNGVTTWNGDYYWSLNQPSWATVDVVGKVTFHAMATSATKAVTITARPKGGTSPARTWSFTLARWFSPHGSGTYAQNVNACSSLPRGFTPNPGDMTSPSIVTSPVNGAFHNQPLTRTIGGVFNQWGRVQGFGAHPETRTTQPAASPIGHWFYRPQSPITYSFANDDDVVAHQINCLRNL